MSPTRQQLVEWLSKMRIFGDTLDIGGDIFSMQFKVGRFKGEYSTTDESRGDLNEIQKLGSFDNIFCLEVTQFVYDPYALFHNLHHALRPGGQLFVTFHLTHPPMKGHDYLRYTEKGIRKILEMSNFKIEELLEPSEGYFLVKCSRS